MRLVERAAAIAVGRRDSAEAGLALLHRLADEVELSRHHPFHVSLALFLEEVVRAEEAGTAWRRATELVDNEAQRRFIDRRLERLTAG